MSLTGLNMDQIEQTLEKSTFLGVFAYLPKGYIPKASGQIVFYLLEN